MQQYPTKDHADEICQLPSHPIPTPHLLGNLESDELMEPQDFNDGDDDKHSKSDIEDEHIENINIDEDSLSEDDSSHPYIDYHSHQSAHKLFKKMFVKNCFGYACKVCVRLWFLNDLKNGTPDE